MATIGEKLKKLVLCGLIRTLVKLLLMYVRTPNFTLFPGTVEGLFYVADIFRKPFLSTAVRWTSCLYMSLYR